MEIVWDDRKEDDSTFIDLCIGDVFSYGSQVYMVTFNSGLKNAVNLITGEAVRFNSSDDVKKLNELYMYQNVRSVINNEE